MRSAALACAYDCAISSNLRTVLPIADARADAQLFEKTLRKEVRKIRGGLVLRIGLGKADERTVARRDHHRNVRVALGVLRQKPRDVALPLRAHGERETGAVGHGIFFAVAAHVLLRAFPQQDAPQEFALGQLRNRRSAAARVREKVCDQVGVIALRVAAAGDRTDVLPAPVRGAEEGRVPLRAAEDPLKLCGEQALPRPRAVRRVPNTATRRCPCFRGWL